MAETIDSRIFLPTDKDYPRISIWVHKDRAFLLVADGEGKAVTIEMDPGDLYDLGGLLRDVWMERAK